MCSVEVLYSLLSDTLVKAEFGFVLVFHINLTTLKIELRQSVLCGTHTSSSIGRSNDRQRFLFARTLFRGRRIGVRIVTHENRSREDWGSFRFLFCVK